MKKSEWINRMQAGLDSVDAQVDELQAAVRGRAARSPNKHEQAQQVLEEKRDAARAKLEEIKQASDSAWEQLKEGAGKVWSQLEKTVAETKAAFEDGLKRGGKTD